MLVAIEPGLVYSLFLCPLFSFFAISSCDIVLLSISRVIVPEFCPYLAVYRQLCEIEYFFWNFSSLEQYLTFDKYICSGISSVDLV
ncbi:unnamed protein product [Trifolium pratense]|uniref:Uncharacterized protein n=1 Tax=Trifolium pratense TaxID=57577 RepID=A0ACB0JPP2_TRIPR|nr:unnamed protein product [Trifolium pratense]